MAALRVLPPAVGPAPIVRERDQLAARLLAEMLQPLFSLGLQRQGIGGLPQEAEMRRRLKGAIDELDTMVDELRAGLVDPATGETSQLVPEGIWRPAPSPISTGEQQRFHTGGGLGPV